MKLRWVLFLSVSLLALNVNATGGGGSEAGNGGDEVSLQFEGAFKKSLVEMKKRNDPFFKEVLNISFSQRLPALKIMTVEEPLDVTVNGVTQECTAMSFPANQLIKVNRTRWGDISTSAIREALALHEVLSLLGMEGTGNYKFSSRYLMVSNIPAELINQASDVRIEKVEFKMGSDAYSIVAKARWQKNSGAFEEARIDYAVWKNGEEVDAGGLKSMSTCTVGEVLPTGFVEVIRLDSQEIGFVINGNSSCGVHSAKRFQFLIPSQSSGFRRIEVDTQRAYQLKKKGDLLKIWSSTVDVGRGPYCCGASIPRLIELKLKDGMSFETVRLPLNLDEIPTFDGNENFRNFPSLFIAGLSTHDGEMMRLSVQYFNEDPESLRYYSQLGVPTTQKEALRLASAMKALGGTLETFESTRVLGFR